MLLELIMVCSTTKENAIALGFNSIYIDGISFHQEFDILNDPTMLGTEN
jgi:hypothetical protein